MLQAFALSDIGCVRRNNEDFYALASDLNLYIVADGIGGAQAGEVAAQLAVETVVENIARNGQRGSSALAAAFQTAHDRVRTAAIESDREGMGCTLVAALIDGEILCLASVGDSRAYVFEDGALHHVTADQTWVNEIGRKLGIPDAELKTHPYRHVLTVAIGAAADAFRVNTYTFPITRATRVLLCTDGLHDVVSDADIASVVLANRAADWKCQSLIDAARAAGGPDNITVLVLDLG